MSNLKRIKVTHGRNDEDELVYLVTPYYEVYGYNAHLVTVSCPAGSGWSTYFAALADIRAIASSNEQELDEVVVEFIPTETSPAWFGIDQLIGRRPTQTA